MSDKPHDHDHIREDETAPAAAPVEPETDAGHNSLTRALNLSFAMLKALMLVVIILFFLDCAQELQQNEIGLVRRFGAFMEDGSGNVVRLQPGSYHLIWPEPIEKLERISMANRSMSLDTEFWTPEGRTLESEGLPGSRESFDPATDGYHLTGDLNIIHTRWKIEYQVDPNHPEDYLLATVPAPVGTPAADLEKFRPERLLRGAATSVILRNVAGLSIDDALGERQADLKRRVLEDIQKAMRNPEPGMESRFRGGLEVKNAILTVISPPARVKTDFDLVTQAMSDLRTNIENAESEARQTVEKAKAEAARIVSEATVLNKRTIEYARADAQYLQELSKQFQGDPAGLAVALEQVRLDVLSRVIPVTSLTTLPPNPEGGRNVLLVVPTQDRTQFAPAGAGANH